MARLARILALLLVGGVLLAACGGDESGGSSGDGGAGAAASVAGEARDVVETLTREARRLADDPRTREGAEVRLTDSELEARELAQRALGELPAPDGKRLSDANERAADAAADLRRYAVSGDEALLARARRGLDRAERSARRVLDRD